MKKKIKYECWVCDFNVEIEVDINEHGFYESIEGYCPNDLTMLGRQFVYETEEVNAST